MIEPDPPAEMDLGLELLRDRLRAKLFDVDVEPRRIGHFALVRQLGEGGQGSVWAAYDEKLDRRVAIKLIHAQPGPEKATAEARLLREARALARVGHGNVVQVFEVDEFEDGVYVVMEFIRGHTLGRWRAEHEPSWEAIRDVYAQAARGLAAAHESGLVHRDFKPDNVLVDEEGRARVVDFGLVKRTHVDAKPSAATSSIEQKLRQSAPSQLTEEGAMLGTPLYWAPEQLRHGDVSDKSDQYSFCVALYESLYGRHPFAGGTPVERTIAMAEGNAHAPPANSPVPAWLHTVVLRGLAPKPEARHASMKALVEALLQPPQLAVQHEAVPARRVGAPAGLVAAVVVGVIVLVVGGVVAMTAM